MLHPHRWSRVTVISIGLFLLCSLPGRAHAQSGAIPPASARPGAAFPANAQSGAPAYPLDPLTAGEIGRSERT